MRSSRRFLPSRVSPIVLVLGWLGSAGAPSLLSSNTPNVSYIVQASSVKAAADAVARAGGTVTQELSIINGVVASVGDTQLARLTKDPGLVLHHNGLVRASGEGGETDTSGFLLYPSAATGTHLIHGEKIPTPKTECVAGKDKRYSVVTSSGVEMRELQGWGVTVAVIDSGFMQMAKPKDWQYRDSSETLVAAKSGRCIVYRDFLPRTPENGNMFGDLNVLNSSDQNGHGTHVISTIADNRARKLSANTKPTPIGVAPQVNLLVARALDKDGAGSYGDVITAIEWVIANKATYNVRVLNLSLYAPVTGPYWADPLNQAVMKAWQSGIVVVAAAGNSGPDAGTITVPGNVPYVITAGAVKSGRYTESGYDELATYSSRGPTESAFVKPDVLVPASRTIAPMPNESMLAGLVADGAVQEKINVDYKIGTPAKNHTYYRLSGTSMAAAQVSGAAALILQKSPGLTNDQVKDRLLATARPATELLTGLPVYSFWEQGSGLVDTRDAVFSPLVGQANVGMDVTLDLTTETHYWGNTTWDESTGEFRLIDPDSGQLEDVWAGGQRIWSGGQRIWSGGQRIWSGGQRIWSGGQRIWSGGTGTWTIGDSLWAGGQRIWSGSTVAPSTATASHMEVLVEEGDAPLPGGQRIGDKK